ncbi:MAG: PSD1 and planctomycete cytochrome C domain-containing protein [Verrucomicrobiales bacterium]
MHLLSQLGLPGHRSWPALALLGWLTHSGAAPVFEEVVAPILKGHCADCHNPETRKGELDLSSPESFLRGGESGPVVKAGDPEHSHLFELVHRGEMPKKGDPLSEEQVETIREWIAEGAAFLHEPTLTEEAPDQHDVLPITLTRCTMCHGPRRQDGGLDLRTPASMRKGGESGPALVEGDADGSRMIQRIESEACPPQNLLLKFFVKRPPSSEVAILRDWIDAGAPEADIQPDVATGDPDPLVTEEDRKHWAFQPPSAEPGGKSVDEFIEAKLKENGLTFSPEADRDTLVRRAYLDLVGMPPSPEEWRKWRASPDPNWFSAMVDHLLESPHYGERWGRYWLDLAGYADSEGGVSSDPLREVAWKYRDYVIRSFNEDKPYDRFLLQQIAGDELLDSEKAEVVTDEMVENLVATGFLRMGIDQTGSRTMNFVPERLGVIGDVINVLGSGVMGLTMECVRCHTHKYDPIPQRDYYRFKAIFQGALDEHDWMSFKTRSLQIATPEQRERVAAVNPPLEKELKALEGRLRQAETDRTTTVLEQHYPDVSEAEVKKTLVALKKADNQRTREQATLVERFRVVDALPDEEQPEAVRAARRNVAELEDAIVRVRGRMEPPLAIRALWDRGEPSPTYILRRGEHDKPSRLVGPGVPAVLTDGKTSFEVEPPFPDGTPKTGRRLAYARWLTQPDHPLTARVMVNRMWHHHFGAGIVRTLENMGVQGAPPTHPELLDWLAVEFVDRGWSVKEMHRLMMNSRAYRQSSRISEDRLAADPENHLLSRMPLRRMDAEALRDSLIFVAGKLDDTPGGPPDPVSVDRDGLVSVDPTVNGGWRRSVYAQYRRTEIPTMMETFDYPEMGPNCFERTVSTVSPQSLMLMNNERVRELAASLATRVEETVVGDGEAAPDSGAKVDAVYAFALSRPPGKEERRLGVETLKALEAAWEGEPTGPLEAYCHTVLNSAAFIHID